MVGHSGPCDWQQGGENKCVACRAKETKVERVYDRAEAEEILRVWTRNNTHGQLVAIEMAARYKRGVLGPLADLIDERVRAISAKAKMDAKCPPGFTCVHEVKCT